MKISAMAGCMPADNKARIDPTLILLTVLALLFIIWLVKLWLFGE